MNPPPPLLPSILSTAASNPSIDRPVNSLKLRLMVCYGGHIVPRPHDKSLTYFGGTTRLLLLLLLLLKGPTSAAALVSRISRSLPLNSRRFTLEYQLPNDHLDSLVSLSSDEDLRNFLDEYDRLLFPSHSSSYPPSDHSLKDRTMKAGSSMRSTLPITSLCFPTASLTLPPMLSVYYSAKLMPAMMFRSWPLPPIKVRIEATDLDQMVAEERSSDQGRKAGVGSILNMWCSDSSSTASGSSLRSPGGSQQMNPNPTPAPDLPYLRSLGSEPAYLMTPPLVDHQYQVLPPQPQLVQIQQHYGNTRANYKPHAAVAGAGQVYTNI